MKLITVEADFAAGDLDAAISLFAEQADTVQAMEGCAHYALYRDPSALGNDGAVRCVPRKRDVCQTWCRPAAPDE